MCPPGGKGDGGETPPGCPSVMAGAAARFPEEKQTREGTNMIRQSDLCALKLIVSVSPFAREPLPTVIVRHVSRSSPVAAEYVPLTLSVRAVYLPDEEFVAA